jgi:hypothetical protein
MEMWQPDYEGVFFLQDRASGFKAIIAIDNTRLGPALGGCRMWQYDNDEAAISDALRLAKGMTYKNAISGLRYGGGKAVILSHPKQGPRDGLLRMLGRYIDRLQGHYITGMDLGTTVADMDHIRETTSYVTDVSGSLGAVNDLTATMTAYGVYLGIRHGIRAGPDRRRTGAGQGRLPAMPLPSRGWSLPRRDGHRRGARQAGRYGVRRYNHYATSYLRRTMRCLRALRAWRNTERRHPKSAGLQNRGRRSEQPARGAATRRRAAQTWHSVRTGLRY